VRILVVEDSAKMADLLRKALVRQGYAVDAVASGQDAVWIATEHDYDAMILDIVLKPGPADDGALPPRTGPAMDGFDVCRTLRRAGRWTPVLMVTARDSVDDRVAGLDAGADDYLPKPFSLDELLARVRAIVRRGAAERPAVLAVGDLALDPAARQVRRGRSDIVLTRTEFALLEHLMRRRGQVLTRRNLIEHVWDYAFDGDPRIVNVYVRSLRNKIDRPFGRSSLETVRGIGYRITDDALGEPAD
jgi:two-component system, OmpR family, response regulator